MKKILFPTDFSETSLNAYLYALRLAKNSDAELVTLHVYDYPMEPLRENYDFILETYKIKEWGDFENFRSEVPRLRAIAEKAQLGRVKVSHMLERGDPFSEIEKAIKTEKPDVVVIGTKGASGLKREFLGSLAEKVMNNAHCTVLAIPGGCRYKPIKRILYLVHYEKMQMDLLHRLHNFALLFNAHIEVLEVKERHDNRDNLILAQWKEHFSGTDISFSLMISSSAEKAIAETIGTDKIDLAALHMHHKGLLEKVFTYSLSHNMAFDAKVPLLALPE